MSKMINVQPLRNTEEITAMRRTLSSGKYGQRNLLLFDLGINTGLRISDIVRLRIEDVANADRVLILEGKTQKKRYIYLAGVRDQLDAYIAHTGSSGSLFPSRKGNGHITTTQAYRVLTDAAIKIGKYDVGTHTLRKTFGFHYYKKTKDVAALMEIFNHTDQAVTKRYIGIRDEEIEESLLGFKL